MEEIFIGLHKTASSPYFNSRTYDGIIDLADEIIELPNTTGGINSKNSYCFNYENVSAVFNSVDVFGNIFFVESNSAHHISYYLAKKAFDSYRQGVKKAVLNIDQHEDYGSCAAVGKMFCGNWGSVIRKEAADYFVEGKVCPGQSENTILSFQKWNGGSINHEIINQELAKPDKCVYVTVDMDVLKGTDNANLRTNWKNGGMTLEELKSTLNNDLNGVNVIAADITGFPLTEKCSRSACDSYIKDIEAVADILKGFIRDPV